MKKAAKLTVKKNAATKKTATKKNARKALDAKETTPPRLKQMRLSLTTAPAKPQNAEPVQTQDADPSKKPRRDVPHCNTLDGKGWIQNSISVWSDIRKSAEEMRLKHPAMFPGMLVERLINTFLRPEGTTILDPFCGSGSTVVAAERLAKRESESNSPANTSNWPETESSLWQKCSRRNQSFTKARSLTWSSS